jgi:hypothetical protein
MLDEVNINPLPPFDAGMGGDEADGGEEGEEGDEGEEDEGDDGVVEVEADGNRKKRRANNYTEIEDATLCRACAAVGMDAVSDTDQTGKCYCNASMTSSINLCRAFAMMSIAPTDCVVCLSYAKFLINPVFSFSLRAPAILRSK